MKTYIICDIGVNANGDYQTAIKLIDTAVVGGADAIKFQYWGVEYIDKCQWRDKLKGQRFSRIEMRQFKQYVEMQGLDFICTAFDMDSFEFVKSLNLSIYKIPSNEYVWNNKELINKIIYQSIENNKKIYISLGKLTEDEVFNLYLDYCMDKLKSVTFLHCVSKYPTPIEECNLLYLRTLQRRYWNINIGISDHSGLPEIPVAAVALGAKVVEVHITLDKNQEGPDHQASLDVNQFKDMVRSIRNVEKAL